MKAKTKFLSAFLLTGSLLSAQVLVSVNGAKISTEDVNNAFDGDVVLVEVVERKKAKKYGKIIKILERKRVTKES